MSNQLNLLISPSLNQKSLLLKIGIIVVVFHIALLGFGTFWHLAPPIVKSHAKVTVQTITLKAVQSPPLQVSPSMPFSSSISKDDEKPTKKNEIRIQNEKTVQPEMILPNESKTIANKEKQIDKKEILSAPPPPKTPVISSQKKELPKQASLNPPKKSVQTPIKKNIEKSAPVKKTTEPLKINQAVKEKKTTQLEKEKQQEIEKKKLQERQEAEKKHQKELSLAKEKEKALLNEAKEKLAKMGITRDKISSSSSSLNLATTNLPKEIGHLQVDAISTIEEGNRGEWRTNEMSYSSEVASRLKMALLLPDYGEVKIKLILDNSGKVIKVETIKSESSKNKIYVENKIPNLLFPSFGNHFQGMTQNTFVITLQNDN